MRDIAMVQRFRRAGRLVSVPAETATYYVAGVSAALRAARPWTKHFIEEVSRAFHRLFDQRLRITSLTRTRALQRRLLQASIGAAPAQGPVQSTHLTGAALDISKRALSAIQVAWLRTVLDRLNRRGLIHVVEEFQEPHFHVMVTRRYLRYEAAGSRGSAGTQEAERQGSRRGARPGAGGRVPSSRRLAPREHRSPAEADAGRVLHRP
jgi:hypothetical protein